MDYKNVTKGRNAGISQNGMDFALQHKMGPRVLRPSVESKRSNEFAQVMGEFIKSHQVKSKEMMVFNRQLASTLGAGLLLTESLDVIAEDMDNDYFRSMILRIRKDIEGGSSFSQALKKHPRTFNHIYIAIIRSGEATGALHSTVGNLAKYLEDTERLREKVNTALRYPLFVLGFAVIVVLAIVLFLIPRFAAMFTHAGARLPLLTRIVVGTSTFMIKYFWLMAILVVLAFVAFWHLIRMPKVRVFIDHILIKMPVIGKNIVYKLCLSRFCRTFGFLLAGGVSVSAALEITSQVVGNVPMARAIEEIRQRVVGGAEINAEIRKQKVFPPLVAKMTAVGEKTGRLSELLDRTADYYDSELENSLQRLASMLEPVMIVIVGGFVLVVVLALYLPIFKMSSAIR